MPPRKVAAEAPSAAGPANTGQFPSNCPQCGGALPASNGEAEIKCPYCGSLVHAAV